MQVGQLSKNSGLFIVTDLGKKKFVSVAVVSDVLVTLYKHCITATLRVLLPLQQALQALLTVILDSFLLFQLTAHGLVSNFYILYVVLYIWHTALKTETIVRNLWTLYVKLQTPTKQNSNPVSLLKLFFSPSCLYSPVPCFFSQFWRKAEAGSFLILLRIEDSIICNVYEVSRRISDAYPILGTSQLSLMALCALKA